MGFADPMTLPLPPPFFIGKRDERTTNKLNKDNDDEMDENDEQIERLESLIMQFEEDGE